ncbi:MAG: CBS domain-containing protein [Candidatus Caldarchaeales archaeon]
MPLFKRTERAVAIRTADLMSAPPITLSTDAKIDDVPGVMWENGVGSVLIVDQRGKLVGIVTERDVLYAASHGLLGKGRPVSAVMSKDLTVATPDEDLASVIEKMRDYNVRHIPVVDSEGRPVGVVSARDVLDYAVKLISLFMRA